MSAGGVVIDVTLAPQCSKSLVPLTNQLFAIGDGVGLFDLLVDAALAELEEAALVAPYTSRGQAYIQLTGWAKHQRVDKPSHPVK